MARCGPAGPAAARCTAGRAAERVVGGAVVAGVQHAQVLVELVLQPLDDVRVGAEFGGELRDRGQGLLGGGDLGQVTFLVDRACRRAAGPSAPRPAAAVPARPASRTMTPVVTKTIISRSGKAPRRRGCSGTASAAASDTAPRNPATALTVRCRAPTRRSRCAGRRSIARMRYGVVYTQANRTPITAPLTAATRDQPAGQAETLVSPRTADCDCSPTSTNRHR